MNFFFDYEFVERGSKYPIEIISVGMVNDRGDQYYAVYDDFDTQVVAGHKWVMGNVMNCIPHEKTMTWNVDGLPPVPDLKLLPEANAKPREQIAKELAEFIGEDAELWAWYSAYDYVCLSQTFGTFMDLPKNVPMYTNDIKTLVKLAGNPKLPAQMDGHHNALADAKQNKVRYDYITDYIKFKDR